MSADVLRLLWMISWQAAVLAGVVWVITRVAKNAPASWRHALWVLVLLKFLVPPFAYLPEQLVFWQKPAEVISGFVPAIITGAPTGPVASSSELLGRIAAPAPQSAAPYPIEHVYGILAVVWIGCCVARLVLLAVRLLRQREIAGHSVTAGSELVALLEDCASRLGVKRIPEVRGCDLIPTPVLVGLFRPVILMPSDIAHSCSPSDQAAMLMHELAHVKRLDMVVLWLYHLVCALFPFHPVLWLVGRQIRRERELACDELVLSTAAISSQDYAAGYISALRLAVDMQAPSEALGMAEPISMERRRLDMILRNAVPKLSRRWLAVMVLTAALGLPTFVGTRAMISSSAATTPKQDQATHLPLAARDHPEQVAQLIKDGDDVNATDEGGRTALHFAVNDNRYDIAKLLVENGANVNVKEHSEEAGFQGWGWYPLHLAIRNENKDMVKLLIDHGADVNAARTDGWTPLSTAAYHPGQRSDIVALLISKGANVRASGEPLIIAVKLGHIEAAKLLIEHGADVNARNAKGQTPLSYASRTDISAVKLLIANKAKIDLADSEGRTPLFMAAYLGYVDIAKLLVSKGANVNARDKSGVSILQEVKIGKDKYLASPHSGTEQIKRDWYGIRTVLLRHRAKE